MVKNTVKGQQAGFLMQHPLNPSHPNAGAPSHPANPFSGNIPQPPPSFWEGGRRQGSPGQNPGGGGLWSNIQSAMNMANQVAPLIQNLAPMLSLFRGVNINGESMENMNQSRPFPPKQIKKIRKTSKKRKKAKAKKSTIKKR